MSASLSTQSILHIRFFFVLVNGGLSLADAFVWSYSLLLQIRAAYDFQYGDPPGILMEEPATKCSDAVPLG